MDYLLNAGVGKRGEGTKGQCVMLQCAHRINGHVVHMYLVARPVSPEVSLLNYVIALLIDEVRFLMTTRINVTSKEEKPLSATGRLCEPYRVKAVSE